MKDRWKAMNMTRTGTVMMLAYAMIWPQDTFELLEVVDADHGRADGLRTG